MRHRQLSPEDINVEMRNHSPASDSEVGFEDANDDTYMNDNIYAPSYLQVMAISRTMRWAAAPSFSKMNKRLTLRTRRLTSRDTTLWLNDTTHGHCQ